MRNVLLIDDDRRLGALLREYFTRFELHLEHVQHPREGLRMFAQARPDLVILDLMMPEMDGFDVCREIRKTSDVPIIMLTARGDVMDRIVGLELGADDYLPKPFEPRELVARVKNILRRAYPEAEPAIVDTLRFEGLCIDAARHTATLEEQTLELTTMEFELLVLLASNGQRTLNRDDILNHLRGLDATVFSRSVDIMVSRLRQKLGDDSKQQRFIKTIWGKGYRFVARPLT
ncbi:MAG: response regulator transcription factor [Gammaproteobacteria bacterium]|nr:response regulator transcription factor [Gammaproteobacteria bacterium]